MPGDHPGSFLGVDATGSLCSSVFSIVATRRGDHWLLKPAETQALGASLDAVLAKYMPDDADRFGPEIALVSCVAMIVTPRLAMDKKTDAETIEGAAAPAEGSLAGT